GGATGTGAAGAGTAGAEGAPAEPCPRHASNRARTVGRSRSATSAKETRFVSGAARCRARSSRSDTLVGFGGWTHSTWVLPNENGKILKSFAFAARARFGRCHGNIGAIGKTGGPKHGND